MKIVGIVQARMASTRLPGKVLMEILGRPMLWHVVRRAQRARTVDQVVVATSKKPADDPVADACDAANAETFRGSEADVLDRYYQTARFYGAAAIVRITADCPLLDPESVDMIVSTFGAGDSDYVSNTVERTYPDGLDAEVFSFDALERAWREATRSSEREHVTPYIWKHPDLFRLRQLRHTEDLSTLRWTVDEPCDLELVRTIYRRLGAVDFRMADVLRLFNEDRALGSMNSAVRSNERLRDLAKSRPPS